MAWEEGINRCTDLNLLPSAIKVMNGDLDKSFKYVELNDIWDEYKIKFTVFDPFVSLYDELWIETSFPDEI